MRSLVLASLVLSSALAPSVALAQRRSAAPCSHRRTDFVEACLGHVLLRSGSVPAQVWIDGVQVGPTPMLVSIDTESAHTFELRPAQGLPLRHTMLLTRARLSTIDLRRGQGGSLRDLRWARFAFFDRCDGFSASSTPHVMPMSAGDFARFRRAR